MWLITVYFFFTDVSPIVLHNFGCQPTLAPVSLVPQNSENSEIYEPSTVRIMQCSGGCDFIGKQGCIPKTAKRVEILVRDMTTED